MADFTSEAAVAVKIQRSVHGINPPKENGPFQLLPPEADQSREVSVSLDMEGLEKTWLDSMMQKVVVEPKRLKTSSGSNSCSIHRVPHRFCQHDEKARVPQIISIGPFHYNKRGDQLQAMEEHKWRYLHDILKRHGESCLQQFLVLVKEMEGRARECYSEQIDLDSYSFVEMMVLDGCFLIELFRKEWFRQYKDDPIFELEWLKHALVIDLIMQENQIPFFILEHLSFKMSVSEPSPAEGALCFFKYWDFFKDLLQYTGTSDPKLQIQHLLHLLHTNLVSTRKIYQQWNGKTMNVIHCASKLREAGIGFKKRYGARKFLDIEFQRGVIKIPPLIVENMTYPIILNLVAFEHSYRHCNKHITAYTYFMDRLINTARDVEILCQNKIIDNWLSSDEEAAALFNSLGREVIIDEANFYLLDVFNDIDRYYGTLFPKMRATLKHGYCRTPCAVVSFIAASVLLFFTVTQAFFSAFPKFAVQKKGN